MGAFEYTALDTAGRELTRQMVVCLLYTSDAPDEEDSVVLGGRRLV